MTSLVGSMPMIELLTTAEMARADQLAIASGTPGSVLMESAGRAVADAVVARGPPGGSVIVVAGPGNNGGDGFVAARLLAEQGFQVRVALFGDRSDLKGDAASAAARWTGPMEAVAPQSLQGAAIIVDALFGAGLARPIEGAALAIVTAMNAERAPVIAVDLPSGISGDTGQILGEAVQAAETVTFFRRKPGHLLLPGRLRCGKLTVADIGIKTDVLGEVKPRSFANEPALWRGHLPRPTVTGHKYDRGHAVIVSGDMPSTGAAKLAARGALRAGAGLVTRASPKGALAAHAAESLAVMVREVAGPSGLAEFLADRRRNAVVLGPGGGVGEGMRAQVGASLQSNAAVVLDADALTSFSGALEGLADQIRRRNEPVVLTPHDGEFARLFNILDQNSNVKSKLEKTRIAANKCGSIVVLKGGDTVIAAPEGRAAITANAPPTLATAGSGDVLAGIISGLLAQHMPAFEAACAGVWLHGEAAAEFGPGLIAEDLPDMLPRVFRRLFD
jgi:hydroxyethylthiazole kinase-like uncharacterized protein yjeF